MIMFAAVVMSVSGSSSFTPVVRFTYRRQSQVQVARTAYVPPSVRRRRKVVRARLIELARKRRRAEKAAERARLVAKIGRAAARMPAFDPSRDEFARYRFLKERGILPAHLRSQDQFREWKASRRGKKGRKPPARSRSLAEEAREIVEHPTRPVIKEED